MSAAFDRLRGYFASKGSAFTDEEFAILRSTFTPASLPADGFLQRSGELATHAVFVVSGVLRVYTVDLNGREHIVQFVPEDWWWSDAASIMSGSPSQYFAQAIEPTELLLTDLPSHRRLLKELRRSPLLSRPVFSVTTPPRTSGSSAPSARRPRSATP